MKDYKAIVFDMDNVLVDTRLSYTIAIKKTAEFFLRRKVSMKTILEQKMKPGNNDDYDCTYNILKGKFPLKKVTEKFQEFYRGKNNDGLIRNERWMLDNATLSKLKEYKLGIFTGRDIEEALIPLRKANTKRYFDVIITVDDVKKKKPNPEGLVKALSRLRTKNVVYIGDSVDDALCAKKAKVDFIGIASDLKVRRLLKQNGAVKVLKNVNEVV